jgi:hypothetical protein
LAQEGVFLDRIYHCPHHPDAGFAGEVCRLKVRCDCRKPQPGMIYRAKRDLNIDLQRSWMVGDSLSDCSAAARATVTPLLLAFSQQRDQDLRSETYLRFTDLLDAVRFIVLEYPVLAATVQPFIESGLATEFYVAGSESQARLRATVALERELTRSRANVRVVRLDSVAATDQASLHKSWRTNGDTTIWDGENALVLRDVRRSDAIGLVASREQGPLGESYRVQLHCR